MKVLNFLLIDLPPRSKDAGLLFLRLIIGGGMLFGHGIGKMKMLFGGGAISFPDPLGMGVEISLFLAVFAEVLCSILIMLGLFTRAALVPLIFTMFVALFLVHLSDPFPKQEKAILYGATYIALFLLGPGRYALDEQLKKRIGKR
ncbi:MULTISPECIES: DoxX family protein [unclassified Aureispira]|uniref:DoxX family protein n=1 Tax=unclassified Aureispira TaxID=2649989 RepID=UPI0006976071|nr:MULTISPECIES: DoxX family protein [unclassified Aureispira]WMX14179.1 DoxX family protein [Aureispira sp. CCB-E]